MATDATGTPTSPDSIPKFNTSVDAPSGLGSNAQMDAIQTALSARASKPAGIVSGEVPVWNGTTWVRSSTTNIGPTSLGSGTPDNTKFLRGDGTWSAPSGAMSQIFDSTLGASAASFDIASISQAYNHLKLVMYLRDDNAGTTNSATLFRFNNDSGANYDRMYMQANGGTVSTGVNNAQTAGYIGSEVMNGGTSSSFAMAEVLIPAYAQTTGRKVLQSLATFADTGSASAIVFNFASTWRSTAAITRLTILPGSGSNFVAGSRVTVYGIL